MSEHVASAAPSQAPKPEPIKPPKEQIERAAREVPNLLQNAFPVPGRRMLIASPDPSVEATVDLPAGIVTVTARELLVSLINKGYSGPTAFWAMRWLQEQRMLTGKAMPGCDWNLDTVLVAPRATLWAWWRGEINADDRKMDESFSLSNQGDPDASVEDEITPIDDLVTVREIAPLLRDKTEKTILNSRPPFAVPKRGQISGKCRYSELRAHLIDKWPDTEALLPKSLVDALRKRS